MLVSDIANAIYDNCDAVILSGETAVGINPANVVNVMSDICSAADTHLDDEERSCDDAKKIFENDTIATSICRATIKLQKKMSLK